MNPSFRKAIVTLALVALACMTNRSACADEVTRVFLFAGQSNMVGADAHADRIDDYPNFKEAGEPQSDVLYSYILGSGDGAYNRWNPTSTTHPAWFLSANTIRPTAALPTRS